MTPPNFESKSNPEIWEFILYIAGDSKASLKIESRLREVCDHYLLNRYRLKIIDIKKNMDDVPPDVLAIPTVIRKFPLPEKRVIGNLSHKNKIIEGLGFDDVDFAT